MRVKRFKICSDDFNRFLGLRFIWIGCGRQFSESHVPCSQSGVHVEQYGMELLLPIYTISFVTSNLPTGWK